MGNLWKNDYKLNLLEIDAQHKRFFEMLENVDGLQKKPSLNKQDVFQMFQFIIAFRTYGYLHFHTEEGLMIQKGYPHFLEHMDKHDWFIDRLNQDRKGFLELYKAHQAGADNLEEVQAFFRTHFNFALEWYRSHITTEDAKYAHYLRKNERR